MAKPPVHRVSEWKIRRLFNKHVLPRVATGDVEERVASEGKPNPEYGQPSGTVSQMVAYWEVGSGAPRQIARAHRYVLPGGKLGASGKPDPKEMLHNGKLLKPHLKSQRKKHKSKT